MHHAYFSKSLILYKMYKRMNMSLFGTETSCRINFCPRFVTRKTYLEKHTICLFLKITHFYTQCIIGFKWSGNYTLHIWKNKNFSQAIITRRIYKTKNRYIYFLIVSCQISKISNYHLCILWVLLYIKLSTNPILKTFAKLQIAQISKSVKLHNNSNFNKNT